MLAFREGAATAEEAVQGATEAEDLEVAELTFGRTTEQMITGGVASRDGVLIWEEGKVEARLSFGLDVPAAGTYELLGAFIDGASHGIVEISFDGRPVLEEVDFYRPEVTSTGPMALGTFDLTAGRSLLSVRMLGTNPEAEPELKFGLDYLKLSPRDSGEAASAADPGALDPIAAAKRRVVEMFVHWFSPEVPEDTRLYAAKLAGSAALRRNPEVRKAIAAHIDREPVRSIQVRLQNILSNDDERYGTELRTLIKRDAGGLRDSTARHLEASDAYVADMLHFRDHAFAEMNRVSERDGRACISCHGVPGRVPTLYLHPPDGAGHIGPADLLANYRKLQQRVNLESPERSLLLRKPLNVQTGQEEGHQGGVRYEPEDEGFRVLRNWVLRQARLQAGGS